MRTSVWRALLVPLVATMLALAGLLLPGARGVPTVAAATVSVPCDTAQLIAAVGNAANDVLNLAAGCTYTLTASLVSDIRSTARDMRVAALSGEGIEL